MIEVMPLPKVTATECFEAVCRLGLEGIVSKRITLVYKSGPSKA